MMLESNFPPSQYYSAGRVSLGVTGTGTNFVDLEFNAGVEAGAPWELSGAMDGITPAVAFPQSGVVS